MHHWKKIQNNYLNFKILHETFTEESGILLHFWLNLKIVEFGDVFFFFNLKTFMQILMFENLFMMLLYLKPPQKTNLEIMYF